MASGHICSLCRLFMYITVLVFGLGLRDVEASIRKSVIHKKVGDTVELSSYSLTEGVTEAYWRYGDVIVADKYGEVSHKHKFKDRLEFNLTSFSLTVRKLTLQDSGDLIFMSEVNGKQRDTVIIPLQVHEPMTQEPDVKIISVTHDALDKSCTVLLQCSTSFDRRVTYKWSVGNQTWTGPKLHHVFKEQDGETTFTCTASNFVSERSAFRTIECNNDTSLSQDPQGIVVLAWAKSLGEVSGYLGDTITLKSGVNPAWSLSKIEWSIWSNHTWIATFRNGRTNTERVHQFGQRLTLNKSSGDLTIRNLIKDDAMEYTVDLLNTDDEEKVKKINLVVREHLQKPTIRTDTHAASRTVEGECVMELNCYSPDDGVNYSWDVEPSSVFTSDKNSAHLLASFNTTQNSVNFTCTTNNDIDQASSVVTLECDGSSSVNSLFRVLRITGLVCGVLLILILLPLPVCCYRKMKVPSCTRFSQSLYINQGSAVHQSENQNETQVYSSLLYGDASVYESIRGSGNTDSGGAASEYTNVTSSHQPEGCSDP